MHIRHSKSTLLFLAGLVIVIVLNTPLTQQAKALHVAGHTGPPPIVLAASPPSDSNVDLIKGSQKQFAITVVGEKYNPPNGNPPGPTLELKVLSLSPSGIQSTVFSASSLTVSPGQTGFNTQVTLTLSTLLSTPSGAYTMLVGGKFTNDTKYVRANNLTFTINVGDFGIAVVPSTIEVRQQGSGSAFVNLSSISNFNGLVSLTWAWTTQPPGVLVSINPADITVPKQSWTSTTLRFDAALTSPIGTYNGFLIGTYAGTSLSHPFPVTVIVKSLPVLEISITANPSPAVVAKISTLTMRVTSEGVPIQLASLTISSTGGTLGATSGFTDTSGQFLTTFNSTVPGQVTISVTATRAGFITGSNSLGLSVVGSFRVSISPSDATMNLGSTRTFQITLQSVDGFNSAVELSVSPTLKGVNATIIPPVLTPPPNGVVSATLTIALNLTATPGAQDFTVTATRSPLVNSAILRLTIPVRDFALVISPARLTIAQSQQGFYNVSILSRGGFSGPVDLRVLGLPDDVESSIVPNLLNLEAGATRSLILTAKTTEVTRAGTFLFVVEANSQGTIRRSIQGVLEIIPLFRVTIDSSPKISAVVIDGVEISSSDLPKQFKWVRGETHAILVPNAIVNGTGVVRYVFTRWADGTPTLFRTVTISDNTVYRAEFKTQFFLTVRTSILEGPLPSTGTGWYDNRTEAPIATAQRINISSDRRYDFRGWTGNLSDTKSNTTVLMDKPKTVVSSYMLQFFVLATTNPGGLADIVNGNQWYDSGATKEFTTTKRVQDYSFRSWTVDGRTLRGLLVSVIIDRPLSMIANYILLPKVGISWANATASKTEFQGESSYVWLKISNSKDRAGEVRLDVQSTFDGIDVSPKSLALNFEPGQSFVLAFELKFLKDGVGAFEAKINETAAGVPDFISIQLKVFPRQSRDNLRGVGKAISVEVLPVLSDLMTPTPEVKALAEIILLASNVPEGSSTVEKARAILKFATEHYEPGLSTNPPNIVKIATDLNLSGGVLSPLKIGGDSRTAIVLCGGLLRSLGIEVRPVIGTMEMSPTVETPYATLHSWLEVKVGSDWVLVDPTEAVLDLASINFPANIAGLVKDSKLFYELSPRWGGPISVVTYESRAIDITDRYKLSAFANLEGYVIYTRGDASITMRDDSGKEFAQGVPYAVVWMPIEPQTTEIRAMRPQGQVLLLSPTVPISKFPTFVSGPKRSDYTFLATEVSSVFPIVSSMAGSFLERGVNEHTVQTKRNGRLQVGQVEHVNYADKSTVDVTSNSTITAAASAIDVRAVKVTLVGREGTAGILNVSVPLNLLVDLLGSSPEKVVALLDNKIASPEINIVSNRMIVSLTYSHSTRNIVLYLKTFQVSFDTIDPLGLRIYDAELTMDGPVTREIKESSEPVFKALIPGQYQFTIRFRGEKQVLSQAITDKDVYLRINLLRSDTTIAVFAAGVMIAVATIAITSQLVLSRVFQRKLTSS